MRRVASIWSQAGRTWAFATAPDLAPLLARERTVEKKLSRAAIETMAIIAYHQPVTRGEIEEIRGVQVSKGTLDVLFEQGWITPKGRRETPGRPATWGTTDAFLRHFGLRVLADLPGVDEMRAAGLLDPRPAIQILRPDDAEPMDRQSETPGAARPRRRLNSTEGRRLRGTACATGRSMPYQQGGSTRSAPGGARRCDFAGFRP